MVFLTGTGENLLTLLQTIIPTGRDVLALMNIGVHIHPSRLVEHNAREDVPLRNSLQIPGNDNARSFGKGFMNH